MRYVAVFGFILLYAAFVFYMRAVSDDEDRQYEVYCTQNLTDPICDWR